MGSLIQDFLGGSQRVRTNIEYYRPRQVGQGPLTLQPELIGQTPRKVNHTTLLQTFTCDFVDTPDIKDKRLVKVFEKLVLANKGIVHIHDRSQRISMMSEANPSIIPVMIPRPSEQEIPGMEDEVRTFETMVPFPKVRAFLQKWQDEMDGPLHRVQLMTGALKSEWRTAELALNF